MSSFSLPSSNPCLSSVKKIQKIVKPFFNATGLNFFSYARDFDKNKSFSLQSDNDLFFAWFESKSPYCSHVTPNGVYSSDMIQNDVLQENAKHLNYGNGLHIFKRYETFSDIVTITAPNNTMNILQFYVNNIDLMNKFIIYFKDKAANIIQDATNNPMEVPEYMMSTERSFTSTLPETDLFDTSMKIDKFYFEDKQGIKLSKREIECLTFYIKGLSSSQIAELMQVKKVTTDTFMRNIKHKFKCRTRSELFQIFADLGIIKFDGVFN